MRRRSLVVMSLAGLITVTCVTGSTAAATNTRQRGPAPLLVVSRAAPDPTHFTAGKVTNQWFPLKPGTRMVYRGVKDGKHLRDVFKPLYKTRTIEGVVCRAVRDLGYLNGVLEERTIDWYAQNKDGDVWYFGERTAELDRNGNVTSREGSWLAGRDGAQPGIYITAHPRVGQTHRQEYYPGHAEDHFAVISTTAHITVPMLATRHAVETKEWSPLEPGVVDHKFYIRDIGLVSEQSFKGPLETARLVSVTHVPPA
jgi:hypothetical protein